MAKKEIVIVYDSFFIESVSYKKAKSQDVMKETRLTTRINLGETILFYSMYIEMKNPRSLSADVQFGAEKKKIS